MSDKVFVAWLALALALMLPSSPWRNIPVADCGQDAWLGAALQPQELLDEEEAPSVPIEESRGQLPNLLEDDEVVHETYIFVVLGLSFKLMPLVQLEPNTLHTRELERPPLSIA